MTSIIKFISVEELIDFELQNLNFTDNFLLLIFVVVLTQCLCTFDQSVTFESTELFFILTRHVVWHEFVDDVECSANPYSEINF